MGRFAQIINIFARHGYWSVLERLNLKGVMSNEAFESATENSHQSRSIPSESEHPNMGVPAHLRMALEELGPAFVKIGQILAVREDILPSDVRTELRKLHSNVSSIPFAEIKKRLMDQLGPEKLKQFESIEEIPLAAGSIAQVHEAVLKDGTRVVIKIQRPAIKTTIETDLELMMTLALLAEKYLPETRTLRLTSLVSSIAEAMRSELDFVREASNMMRMSQNFGKIPYVKIPSVVWDLCTDTVLTMEQCDGFPGDAKDQMLAHGIDVKLLVTHGLEMFMRMVFVDGFIHGDLHPGNLLAQKPATIALLDFGMVVRFSRRTRENLAGMLVALAKEDYESMVYHYLEIVDVDSETDVQKFQTEVANAVSPYVGLSLQQSRSGKLLWELARIAARNHVPFSQELIVFVKSMATFESIGTKLDPSFNILEQCQDFAQTLVREAMSPKVLQEQAMFIARDVAGLMRHAPLQTRRLLNSALEGQLKLQITSEEATKVARSLERGTSRLAAAIVVGALLIGSSILIYAAGSQQPLIGIIGFVIAGILAIYIAASVLRSSKHS